MRVKPREIILTLKRNDLGVNKTASDLGIHRTTIWRWKKKAYVRPGVLSSKGLKRNTTKPHNLKKILGSDERVEIEKLRRKTGWTAERITKKLNLSIHHRTVHRFLKRKELVREYGYYRRPRFQDTAHMHAKNTKSVGYLQMDVKYITPELSGLRRASTSKNYNFYDFESL